MPLPYPTKVVLPFDIATAQDMNERHANDVALANGSGLDNGAVTASKLGDSGWLTIAFTGYTGDLRYRKIGNRVQLGGSLKRNAGSIPTSDTSVGTIPVGYRPSDRILLPVGSYGSGTLRDAWIDILTSGAISCFASGTSGATDTLYPGGVSFLVD